MQTAIARSPPLDADVDVQAEGVVAPDDVPEQLVVAAVVRRVDDPLVLPARPRMRAGRRRARRPSSRASACSCARRSPSFAARLGEVGAAAGAHLDLGGDQLADEVRLELGAARRRLQLLEAVDELERLGVEERELLLDRDA